MNHRALFMAFNGCRRLARDGYLDRDRVNRALGIAQAREPRPYETTVEDCNCADHVYRKRPCKHIIAALIRGMAEEIEWTERKEKQATLKR